MRKGGSALSPPPKLETRHLSVAFHAVRVVCGVSLAMPDRQVTALLGPSGSGKSTFLRALNRMHDRVPGARISGRILLDGRETAPLAPEPLRRRIGMVFQRPNPFPTSIYENVAFGPSLARLSREQCNRIVRASLEAAALWDEVKHRLHQDARSLSGGQQQRLCIARALAVEPEVLLMDEPCSALDPAATAAVEELILGLRRRMAVVLVTHSIPQSTRVADRRAWLRAGRLELLES